MNWVNLQYGCPLQGCLNPELKNWEDTIAVIAALDSVVTVDSAIANLALSMDKPTIILFGTAPTSVVKYIDYKSMFPTARMKLFYPIYGGSQAAHSWELFIRWSTEKNMKLWHDTCRN